MGQVAGAGDEARGYVGRQVERVAGGDHGVVAHVYGGDGDGEAGEFSQDRDGLSATFGNSTGDGF